MVVPALLLVVVDGVALAFARRLPDPVAVHFAFDGAPNGSMSLAGLLVFQSAFWVFMQLYTLVLGRGGSGISGWRRPLGLRGRYVSAYATFGVLSSIVLVVILANLDQPTWGEAHSSPGALVAIALAGGIGAAIGAVVVPDAPRVRL